mgnify:CR=1 FL=1
MLANLTTPLLGVVSTGAIGQLGDAALLGGVALASVAFDCVFWLFGFLRMATVAFTAQALGADDRIEIRAVLIRALLLAALIGAVLIALRAPLASLIFSALGGSDAVTAAATSYFHIRLWSAPFMLGNYVMLGWLVGQARTGLALGIQVGINLLNMALTIVFVLMLHWGIAGAAIATVIAETTGFASGLVVARILLGPNYHVPRALLFDRVRWLRMLAVNRDIMIRTAALIGAFLFFTAQGARAGDRVLAANAVLYNFLMIGSFFLDGLANAAEQLCGQTFGARDRVQFARAVRLVLAWSIGFGVAVSLGFIAAGDHLIDIITTSPDVRLAGGAGTGLRRAGLLLRRRLHRRIVGARHAQPDGDGVHHLHRRLVCADAVGQCRIMDRVPRLPAGAGPVAGDALSGAGARDLQAGQSSAVMAAASAPTISDNESCPVRSSVATRSLLMLSIRLRPL